MPLVNPIRRMSLKRIGLILIFVLVYLVTRVPRLQNDIINPDGVNWHYRSQQFINGLKYGDLNKTYQHYHPGVTVMWITAPAIELYRQIPGNDKYDMYNFMGFDFVAKFSLVLAQLILTLVIVFYLTKIIGFNKSLLAMSILSLEPFFVGNSRLYHLDILLSLFLFLSLCLYYLALQNDSKKYFMLTGISVGLAFLTKTIGIVLFAYLVLYTLLIGFINKKSKHNLLMVFIFIVSFCASVFAFFPALWVNAAYIIPNLFSEGMRVGVRKGHDVIVLGEDVMDGGILFYPLVLLIKLSPFLLSGFLAYVIITLKSFRNFLHLSKIKQLLSDNFTLLLIGFYLGYFIIMTVPSKKLDRYMLVEYPVFAYCTLLFFNTIHNYYKNKKAVILAGLLGFSIFVIVPLFELFPFYFTYTSPVVGNATYANSLIGQKPFGVGIYDVKDFILKKYGYYPRLAFVDVKPIESIYPSRLVRDIREVAVEEYDLAVLGPNEEFPPRVERSPFKLVKDSSIYINGLEYWRIYVKRPK
ncbi:phospholipid carrier-dependent glycosyltransferase [candidate division WWE3 bacterium]|uniref:Phospholipid carrier-dependent glycosyltransferase n=1 Tax=candidate division WWE3 bacterium TaxID=2053526 RepID=A0A7X9DKL9_UNCKA|nr:phospholipid carrier-dependent glycosyltransferase [candidate division WWE3 bacterium]